MHRIDWTRRSKIPALSVSPRQRKVSEAALSNPRVAYNGFNRCGSWEWDAPEARVEGGDNEIAHGTCLQVLHRLKSRFWISLQ